jgi:hypothetical protein
MDSTIALSWAASAGFSVSIGSDATPGAAKDISNKIGSSLDMEILLMLAPVAAPAGARSLPINGAPVSRNLPGIYSGQTETVL